MPTYRWKCDTCGGYEEIDFSMHNKPTWIAVWCDEYGNHCEDMPDPTDWDARERGVEAGLYPVLYPTHTTFKHNDTKSRKQPITREQRAKKHRYTNG